LCTISSTTLVNTTMKNNDILDKLFDGDMSPWYVASISSSQIPSWISYPLNRRWPSCFKILTDFYQVEWYSPIFIFLMDVLLVLWNG
jgi:hypothetical protein